MSNIVVKVDFNKIDQSKLFEGAKGRYFDIVLIETPNGQYGDYMAVQGTSKEERTAGVKGAILGNGKRLGGNYAPQASRPQQASRRTTPRSEGAPPCADSGSDDYPW